MAHRGCFETEPHGALLEKHLGKSSSIGEPRVREHLAIREAPVTEISAP